MASVQNKKNPAHIPCKKSVRGTTLIEILVAAIILSIGLLGIAGLQASVTRYKINSWARSAVSNLYSDLADRIRLNTDAAGTSMLTGVTRTSQYLLNSSWNTQQTDTLTTPSPNCETAVCTNAQRATYDMIVWRQLVRSTLPQGSALVSGDLSSGINLTIMWFDKEMTDKGNASDSVLVSSETCTGSETGMARQSCCPAAASVPAGVRCARFLFTP